MRRQLTHVTILTLIERMKQIAAKLGLLDVSKPELAIDPGQRWGATVKYLSSQDPSRAPRDRILQKAMEGSSVH